MIQLSRLNGKEFFVNSELIKTVESTPDTLITLLNNEKFMVKESVEVVIERVMQYQKRIHQEPPQTQRGAT